MFDAFCVGLDVAEHHRRGALATEHRPLAEHFEPLVGGGLLGRDDLAHAFDEDLGAAAGDAVEASLLEVEEHVAHGALLQLGEVRDLRRAHAVDPDLRVALLQVGEQLREPVGLEFRVVATLQQQLDAALRNELFDLLVDDFARQHVALGVAGTAVERAEAAVRDADVRRVEVAVDDVGHARFAVRVDGVHAHANVVGADAERRLVEAAVEDEGFVGRKSTAVDRLGREVAKAGGISRCRVAHGRGGG